MDSTLINIKHLIESVESINKRYAEVHRVYEESGVQYNIFNVLGLSSSEVRLHSSILASLFRTKEHGAGNAFLEAFLKLPVLELPEDFLKSGPVSVETEKYLGPKTTTHGGRIDLYLSDGKDCLVIENKIYAGDQEHQLLRYHNEAPNAKLVYLTLDGKTPSEDSLGGLSLDQVTCISYQYDIIDWLNECVKIAANLPYVRETINQYIKTIKQLTNTDMPTNSEIIKLITQKDNIYAAFAIRDNFNEALNLMMERFVALLRNRLKEEELPFTCITGGNGEWTNRYSGIYFEHKEWRNVVFGAQFDGTGLNNLFTGLCKRENSEVIDISTLQDVSELASRLGYKRKTQSWYWEWAYGPEPICVNWNNAKTMEALENGQMATWFMEVLKRAHECSKGLTL